MATRKDKEKGWLVDFVFKHADGRRQRVKRKSPVQTRRGAQAYERQLREELLNPTSPIKEVPNLRDFSREFMETYVVANNKKSEQMAKECIFRVRLLPAFGHRRLDEIPTREIERAKARWITEGLSQKRINNILTVLGKTLRYAEELALVDSVPRIKFLKVPLPDFDFLDFDELDQLVDGTDEADARAAILCAARAGLRAGEVRTIQWSDIDFAHHRLTVQRTDYRGYEGVPKGGRLRRIPLSADLERALKAIRHLRGAYVFSNGRGRRWSRGEADARLWRGCRKAKVRKIGWQVLRHTFCSHLAMRGAPARAIQELAGHSSLSTTQRYMHLSPNAKRGAIDLLDGASPWPVCGPDGAMNEKGTK